MKLTILHIVLILIVLLNLISCDTIHYEKTMDGLKIKLKDKNLFLQVAATNIIHITISPESDTNQRKSLIVDEKQLEPVKWEVSEMNKIISLTTDELRVTVYLEEGFIAYFDKKDNEFIRFLLPDTASFKPIVLPDGKAYSIKQKFELSEKEGIYGLGQFQDGVMDFRGHEVNISQSNTNAVVPFMVSTKGYGILWDNYSKSIFHDDLFDTYFWSEAADAINFYFIAGNKMDDVIAGYRKLTGKAPMFGKWAYGYWQSKERYKTSDEVLQVASEYRKRQLPIDNLVQDWSYWGEPEYFSGMVWDTKNYPNPKDMIDQMHKKYNMHLILSIWPAVGNKSEIYKELDSAGLLYSHPHWAPAKVYDAYSEKGREIYWKYARKAFWDIGLDGWWMDATEPEFMCTDDRYISEASMKFNQKNAMGSFTKYLNTFSLMTTKGIYENQRKESSDKRVFILTRSTFAGQQKNAAVLWSGDIWSSWKVYRNQISAGLNVCMAGIPYWTSDVGGFISGYKYPDGIKDPAYRELYVRWFQYGAFCPIFRSHGTSTPREIWQFGDKGSMEYEALLKTDKLRYRLMPYIYSLAWKVTNEGYTMMRGLPMDFPKDRDACGIDNQFMFGPAIMVCPVTKAMYNKVARIEDFIPSVNLLADNGKEMGLKLEFFEGTHFEKPVLERKTDVFNITWSGALPQDLKDKTYSVRYSGKLLSKDEGDYTFVATTDGGIKLWVNDQLIIDDWGNTIKKQLKGQIKLKKDEIYNLKLEQNQSKPNVGSLVLEWITPGLEQEIYSTEKKSRAYIPANTDWYDFWEALKVPGNMFVDRDSPLDIIPLFVKAGSILPLGPDLQYSTEKQADPIELRVYTGTDGEFTLYEDENDNYNYEKGAFALIPLNWNEQTQTLTIGERKGQFPGMLEKRIFNIVWVSEKHGVGVEPEKLIDKVIEYSGKKVEIKK